MRQVFILICLLIILVGFGCKDSPQPCLTCPPGPERISIDTLLVDPTEAWLKLRVLTDELPGTILRLTRNDKTILTHTISSRFDTTLHDINLLPSQHYQYRASLCYGVLRYTSPTLDVTTMDTTSHNFTWQINTLGTESSVLNDVAIINDTSVWVVGNIHIKDTVGNLITYNLAKWNGFVWSLLRVPVPTCGSNDTGTYPLYTILSFSEADIWFCSGGSLQHWDGQQFIADCGPNSLINGQLLKMWGTSPQNLYVVGRNGTIVHFDGQSWEKQESGTDVDLLDVWGTPDGTQVWVCGENHNDGRSVLLVRRDSTGWVTLWNNRIPTPPFVYSYGLSTLWTSGRKEFMLSGSSGYVYHHSLMNLSSIYSDDGVNLVNYPYRLRGSARNNVVIAGDEVMMWHFNGVNWHRYNELSNPNDLVIGLAVSDQLVVAVGSHYVGGPIRNALVVLGRK